MRSTPIRFALLAILFTVACTAAADGHSHRSAAPAPDSATEARARQDSINRAQPGYIVDSILPTEEETRRFREAVGGRTARALSDGAASLDALVASFAHAVASRDTAALHAMALSPREFIDLVYPSSPFARPPYRQSPALTWSQIQLPSASGSRRLLDRLGGRPLRIVALDCPPRPERQGVNTVHAGCVVTFTSGAGVPRRGRLFGSIIERDGQFKFVSYSNMY